jgi:hypothetical protein
MEVDWTESLMFDPDNSEAIISQTVSPDKALVHSNLTFLILTLRMDIVKAGGYPGSA